MSLNKLKPALGSVQKKGKRLGRGQGSGKGGHPQEVTRELNQDQDTQRLI